MQLKITYTTRQTRLVLVALLAVATVFVALYALMHIAAPDVRWGPPRAYFDLDGDTSIPAWFSATQLFVVAALIFMVMGSSRVKGVLSRPFMIAAALVFLFLSADEAARIHENITGLARTLRLDWLLLGDGQYGAWIPLYGLAALVILVLAARSLGTLWRHFRQETMLVFLGFGMIGLGAVGLELLSFFGLRAPDMLTWFQIQVAAEEFLEMAGVSVILYAVLLLGDPVGPRRSEVGSANGHRPRRREKEKAR